MTHPQLVTTIFEKSIYEIPLYSVTDEGPKDTGVTNIVFCKGNKADPSVLRQEGVFTESLLAVCAQYLRENNVGDLLNRDTSIAITHIEDALLRLGKRAEDRKIRGVQGTYLK